MKHKTPPHPGREVALHLIMGVKGNFTTLRVEAAGLHRVAWWDVGVCAPEQGHPCSVAPCAICRSKLLAPLRADEDDSMGACQQI